MKVKYLLLGTVLIGFVACDSSKEVATNQVKEGKTSSSSKNKESVDVSYIDNSVRPQDDFFMYANGNWVKNNPVPESESRWGSFNELEQSNNKKLTDILESYAANPDENEALGKLLGTYYASFLDMESRNSLGLKPIQGELEMVDNLVNLDELNVVLAKLHAEGVPGFFNFGIGQDLKNNEVHVPYLGQGGLGLPNKDYYIKNEHAKVLESYTKHIENIFKLAGENNAADKAGQIVDLELAMAKKMMTPAEMRVPENTYHLLSKDVLMRDNGGYDWDVYFSETKSHVFRELVVTQPDYIAYLNDNLFKNTSIDVVKAYLKWKILNHYAGHLSTDFVNEHFNFYGTILSGTSVMKPANERAIKEITSNPLGDLLGTAFVGKYYSSEAQARINTLVDNLLIVFRERINNLEWMSAETKEQALNKLNSIGRKLGFPEEAKKDLPVTLNRATYLENVRELAKYEHTDNMSDLKKPVDKKEWGMPAHMVNAYYHPLLNEIAFPAGIMQPPFFSENYEDAVNYGRIGMVIGHEFTHGFDDMGSKFAADGSFTNWWTESDRTMFEERTNILGGTFSAFCTPEGECVNPDLTMGENIADLGGLTLAYYAYTKTDEFKSGAKVDGFTPSQRFFLAYAQLWKINYTEAELKKRLATDPHSPGMYRVNGPLKNCPEFFEAFNVKEGDPMRNLSEKVARIW